MPYKRRRSYFRRRRSFRRTRKGRVFSRFRKTFRKKRRFSYRRTKRTLNRRAWGRGGRIYSKWSNRFGITTKGGTLQAKSGESEPHIRAKYARRAPKLRKFMRKAIDRQLGDKYIFKLRNTDNHTQTNGQVGGEFTHYLYTNYDMYNYWLYAWKNNSNRWSAGGHTNTIDFNYKTKIDQLGFFFVVTNNSSGSSYVRFSETRAKRDIPLALASDAAAASYYDPIGNAVTYYEAQNRYGEWSPDEAATAFTTNQNTYNFWRNRPQSFPGINYYYNIKPRKVVRLEPGATAKFSMNWTPSMTMDFRLFSTWQDNQPSSGTPGGAAGRRGILQWKGLNDRGVLIESIGINTYNSTTGAHRLTNQMMTIDGEATIAFTGFMYRGGAHYTQVASSETIDTAANIFRTEVPSKAAPIYV